MLFCLNKHYIKNFKNLLISQYIFTKKQKNFKKIINIKINFNNNTFFLANFLLNTFTNKLFYYNIKKLKINLFLTVFNFFFIFINVIYPYLKNLKYITKKSLNYIFFNFEICNFFINPISNIKYKNFINNSSNIIFLNTQLAFKKENFKYIQFFFNFFQIPVLIKW